MKIALICDMHLPENPHSPQYAFLSKAAQILRLDGIDTVICLGDSTSYGQPKALSLLQTLMQDFHFHLLLGNSDVRDNATTPDFMRVSEDLELEICGRKLMGINTPFAQITPHDRERISRLHDGDILLLHHAFHGFFEECRTYLEGVAHQKALTIIHAHAHKRFDYQLGKSRVFGLRALDPDKSIGNFPCITYLNMDETAGSSAMVRMGAFEDVAVMEHAEHANDCSSIRLDKEELDVPFRASRSDIWLEEKLITLPVQMILDVRAHFGISCVDNHADVSYATEHGAPYIELRCNGADWTPDLSLLPKIDLWRRQGGRYLSVHMPNVRWNNGALVGMQTWYQAAEYAKMVGTQGLTMHPPRVKKADMTRDGAAWKEFLKLYTDVVGMMGDEVKIGIENLHMEPDERDDESRGFGCNPEEVLSWMDAINRSIGKENRVGHTLDVGHARNNGSISEGYPISRWYEQMGDKTVAYHIHQVVPRSEGGLKNHQAIEEWFGPLISYVSFFYAWDEGMLNHVPVFLEVGGSESFDRSICAFSRCFGNQ